MGISFYPVNGLASRFGLPRIIGVTIRIEPMAIDARQLTPVIYLLTITIAFYKTIFLFLDGFDYVGYHPIDRFSFMFLLKSDDVELQLEIVPVASLIQHEEIISRVSHRLTMEFANLTYLRHPVIIEKNNIVLDGNHRVTVFKKLGFTYIPVCRIDYHHPSVKLRYWFRVLKNLNDPAMVSNMIGELGGCLERLPTKQALLNALQSHDFSWGIQQKHRFYFVRFSVEKVADAIGCYQVLEKLQNRLVRKKVSLEYIPCESVQSEDDQEMTPDDMIIWTPQLRKEMIISAAQRGQIFAPKTTRHLIPARPLNINVPGPWLNDDISLGDINRRLFDHLADKQIRQFGPGQVIDGRFYGEKLFVFYD